MAIRRFAVALLSVFMAVTSLAANKDLEKDITMVSYEQGWLDSEGTLALKNNSSEEVTNVVFLITYLDMSGNELDYEEFTRRVSIAPGMTRKLDIPAYEHDRNYHYYKSENMPGGSPSFKIKFKLKDYNVEDDDLRCYVPRKKLKARADLRKFVHARLAQHWKEIPAYVAKMERSYLEQLLNSI